MFTLDKAGKPSTSHATLYSLLAELMAEGLHPEYCQAVYKWFKANHSNTYYLPGFVIRKKEV